jgi:cation diffusion facilitator CzcD-associated flavoprotein CzcO
MASGPLNRPKLPGVPGVGSFKGHTFHTSRWDYDYTGGDSHGGLTKLSDKRVGIIGTGATAVQCVPHLGEEAEHLYVFQRTPSSVDVRGNRPTDPEWAASLESGWQKRRMENFTNLVSGIPEPEDLVNDGWTDIVSKLAVILQRGGAEVSLEDIGQTVELADFEKMNQVRARVDELVEDPATADSLKPWYRQFCKRPCFHDDYLQTFNRPNVTLVDTQGRGVDRITERGVVVGEVEYELDCLIFATGFEFGTDYSRRAGCEIVGRDGVTLTEKWADGVRTLHGMHSRGFPNCFIMSITQTGVTVNFPHMIDEQARHVAYLIDHATRNDIAVIETTQDAEDGWVETIIELSANNRDFFESCTPGYYNNEGQLSQMAGQNGFYGGGALAFFQLLEAWRNEGTLDGLECTSNGDAVGRDA